MDPIRDSWEDRIRSVRMSSKNLVGENAETCKKVSKNQYTNAVQFRAQNNPYSNCVLANLLIFRKHFYHLKLSISGVNAVTQRNAT